MTLLSTVRLSLVPFTDDHVDGLNALNSDIIIPLSPLATAFAHKATKTIPIVCIAVHDPVGMGYAASLARPGGNLTINRKTAKAIKLAIPQELLLRADRLVE